jgi:uracil-DNA glycosylase family 4
MNKAPGANCSACPLQSCKFVPSELRFGASVLVVGEAPGAEEAIKGAPFVGQSGKLLNAAVIDAGYTRDNLSLTNIVACRPPNNIDPPDEAIEACWGRLLKDIREADPKYILTLGKVAREVLLPNATEYRGAWGRASNIPVMSTWHPAYVLRKPSEATTFLHDVRKVFEGPVQHSITTAPKCITPETYEELAQVLSTAPHGATVAYDLETNQTVWYDRPGKKANSILMMGISWDPSMGVIIGDELLYDDPRTTPLLTKFFGDVVPGGHNVKFDNIFMRTHLDLNVRAAYDTLLMHYILDENSKHGLKVLAFEEFGLEDYEADLVTKYLKSKNDEYSKVPFNDLAQYCAWDVATTLSLQRVFQARLYHEDLYEWPYDKIYMPAQEALTTQQIRGVQIDIPYLQQCYELFTNEMERIRRDAGMMVGRPDINLNSPTQVGTVLWDHLKLRQSGNRKVKDRSTNELAVMHLRGKHPFVDQLMRHRRIAKLKSSYIENMMEYADVNGRVHPDALLYGTEMGRIAMREPAVQTIPRPTDEKDTQLPTYDPFEDGAVIRGAVIAGPGNVFGAVDFSQAELRTLAFLSGEPFLIKAYEEDRDIHTEVTQAMFGDGWTREQRVKCKMFNFSYVYGGSEYSFAEDAGLPIAEARAFVRKYDSVMPIALAYKKSQYDRMRSEGYVETLFKLRRRFPLITPENQDDARKASVHGPVAGTAAAVTVIAQTKLIEEGVPVVMSVHDSIEIDSPEDQIDEHLEHTADVMMQTAVKYMPTVKWKVDPEKGQRWVNPPALALMSK